MQNASGNRSPIHPDTFINALQNADSHTSAGLARVTTGLRSAVGASPNTEVSRHQRASRPIPSAVGSAGQIALPNASAARPTSIVASVANASTGSAGHMAVPSQQHMSAPTAVSVHARSAAASDRRGNTMYVQQVLQQIQHNPDPRLIENFFTDTDCLIQLLCGLISKTPARCGEGGVEIHHHSNSCVT